MGYANVEFLGEEYQISDAVNEFLKYDQLLSPITKKSLDMLSSDISHDCGLRWDAYKIEGHVRDTAGRYIGLVKSGADLLVKKLVSMGIYDVTTADILKDSTAIDEIAQLQNTVFSSLLSQGQKIMELKNAGRMYAYNSAASKITGSGVRIFTSSFAMLMLHSAVEKSILMSQAKKADQEYENAIKKINSQAGDALDQAYRSIMLGQFYPSIMQILLKYINQVMSSFLVETTIHGKFDFDSVKDYDMQKAIGIVKNIDWSPDKAGILRQAFLTCPFALEVYEACLNYELMDQGTFDTAVYFGMGPVIAEKLELYVKNNQQFFKTIKPIVQILAAYKKKDEKFIWESVYYHALKNVKDQYAAYNEAVANKKALDKYIRSNFGSQTFDLVNKPEEEMKNYVNKRFNSVIREETYNRFVELGILSPESIRLTKSSATSLAEINEEIKTALISAIIDYVKEAKRRLAVYDEAKTAFDEAVKKKQTAIDTLKDDKGKLGFWAFSKKKQLTAEIEQKSQELIAFKDSNEPKDLWRDFERMYS